MSKKKISLEEYCKNNNMEYLLNEWNYKKNKELGYTPENITYKSGKKVWWLCEEGHEWEAVVANRVNGNGCPYCSGRIPTKGYNDLETTHPHIVKEWHPTLNGSLKPNQVSKSSKQKVWWLCKEGHKWETTVEVRTSGCNCPYCSGKKILKGYNDLETTHPYIAKEWHPTLNGSLKPSDVSKGINKKIWWLCDKGHKWKSTVLNRTKGSNCPYCSGKKILKGYNDLETTHPHIVKEWHPTLNGSLKPSDVSKGSNKKVWWLCNKGHEWETTVVKRTNGNNCPKCYQSRKTSFPEKAIYFYIQNLFDDILENYKIDWLNGKELDIFIPSLNLAIEYDGEYYHKDKFSKIRDEEKNILCLYNNIYLIRVREEKCIELDKIDNLLILNQIVENKENLEKNILKIINFINEKYELNLEVDVNIKRDRQNIYNLIEYQEIENNLEIIYPHIAKEWHPTLNGDLKPSQVSKSSHKKVWWLCEEGHEWEAVVANRVNGNGCPYCSGRIPTKGYNDLETTHPHIVKEWHPTLNGDLKPNQVSKGSDKKVWWKCQYCNKDYERSIYVKVRLKKCPNCKTKYNNNKED